MIRKRLGQSAPVADTNTLLYNAAAPVPPITFGVTRVSLKSVYVTNLDFQNGEDYVSLWLVASGETLGNKHCILNRYPLAAAENVLKVEMIIEEGDSLVVKSERGVSTFMAFGDLDYRQDEDDIQKDRANYLCHQYSDSHYLDPDEFVEVFMLKGGSYQNQSQSQTCGTP